MEFEVRRGHTRGITPYQISYAFRSDILQIAQVGRKDDICTKLQKVPWPLGALCLQDQYGRRRLPVPASDLSTRKEKNYFPTLSRNSRPTRSGCSRSCALRTRRYLSERMISRTTSVYWDALWLWKTAPHPRRHGYTPQTVSGPRTRPTLSQTHSAYGRHLATPPFRTRSHGQKTNLPLPRLR